MINVAGLTGNDLAEAIQRNFDELESRLSDTDVSAAVQKAVNNIESAVEGSDYSAYFWKKGNAFGVVLQNADGDKRYFGLTEDGSGAFPVEVITETE